MCSSWFNRITVIKMEVVWIYSYGSIWCHSSSRVIPSLDVLPNSLWIVIRYQPHITTFGWQFLPLIGTCNISYLEWHFICSTSMSENRIQSSLFSIFIYIPFFSILFKFRRKFTSSRLIVRREVFKFRHRYQQYLFICTQMVEFLSNIGCGTMVMIT